MKILYSRSSKQKDNPDKCATRSQMQSWMCLKNDENSRVACEVLATKGNIIVAGEITSAYEPDVFAVVRKVYCLILGIPVRGLQWIPLSISRVPISQGQSILQKERKGRECPTIKWTGLKGAGDQGVMIGYACDETKQLMPMPVVLANRIVRELSACRQSSYIQGILPDGKAQVTVEYENGKPVRLDSVVVSCQHTEDKNLKKLEAEIRKRCFFRHFVSFRQMKIQRSLSIHLGVLSAEAWMQTPD